MDDVPEIAGSLTTWHLHEDLCWDATGTRVIGVFRDGRCLPGRHRSRTTTPMLHVWREPQVCGPFAEAETDDPVDRFPSRSATTTTKPPEADPCMHEHTVVALSDRPPPGERSR